VLGQTTSLDDEWKVNCRDPSAKEIKLGPVAALTFNAKRRRPVNANVLDEKPGCEDAVSERKVMEWNGKERSRRNSRSRRGMFMRMLGHKNIRDGPQFSHPISFTSILQQAFLFMNVLQSKKKLDLK